MRGGCEVPDATSRGRSEQAEWRFDFALDEWGVESYKWKKSVTDGLSVCVCVCVFAQSVRGAAASFIRGISNNEINL